MSAVEVPGGRNPLSVRFLSCEEIACTSHKDLTEGGLLMAKDRKIEKSKAARQTPNARVYVLESNSASISILSQTLHLFKCHLADIPEGDNSVCPTGLRMDNVIPSA